MKNTKKRKKSRLPLLLICAAIVACLTGVFFLFNRHEIVIEPNGENPAYVEYGDTYQEEGAVAYYHETLIPFLKKELEVKTAGAVDVKKLGEYPVTYSAEFHDLNEALERKVIVRDTVAPEIKLTADPDGYTTIGHKYEEEGFTATDNYDGDLTEKVVRTQYKDSVVYVVKDSSGNTARATRTIVYDDRHGPDISFPQGAQEETAYIGSQWINDYYAEDDVDGDVTANVQVDGSVDTGTAGDYELVYTVTDAHGNRSEITRIVHVVPRPSNNGAAGEDSKTIYLTFDDGPYAYTEELLDILARYDVKATFFTTSAYPQYAYCMALAAQQGHTVAVHTTTHNYAYIYASESNYWEDFNNQNAVIAAQTGSYTNMFRFPGGSSNTVSANYNTGIMSRLAAEATARGYVYFDWNVSSGDAGGTTDTNDVYLNVISGIEACSNAGVPSVVLQHDVKAYSVNAVEDIIKWGLANGYHFSALSPGSYAPHQRIAN